MFAGQLGISSSLTAVRSSAAPARKGPPRTGPPAASEARAARSTDFQRPASCSPRRSAFSSWVAARSSLIIAPVSIDSGQVSAQVPSAAQVSIPSYRYSSSRADWTGEPFGWRAISRRMTMRWRGVRVRWRLGQTGSQNPHSTQFVATSSIGGVVFRFFRWAPASRFRTTPGASTPSGSASSLIRHISSVAFSPHSRST